jgi:hypothetical protein
LANFFGSGVLALCQKLGPILLARLPPNLGFDADGGLVSDKKENMKAIVDLVTRGPAE